MIREDICILVRLYFLGNYRNKDMENIKLF